MSPFTAEQLLDAIRNADSLGDLQRMVGPSLEDRALSDARVHQIDRLFEKHPGQPDPATWPWPDNETYQRLSTAQGAYENTYC